MTRETRIGLVVGLAFIVLFGVVLSELGAPEERSENKHEGTSESFFAEAPLIPQGEPQAKPKPLALVAQRRAKPPTPAAKRAAPPAPRPAPKAGRPPRRTVPAAPRAPSRNVDSREMTPEQFAARHGIGVRGRTKGARTYVTRRGDSLTAIARKFYRTPSRKAVMKIFNANRNVLRSPDVLGVDVKLVIPN